VIVVDTLALRKRALQLEYITIGWMVIETSAIIAGIAAHSVALTGFGLDSVIELASAGVVLWQLRGVDDHREHTAHRLIAASLYALAFYIVIESTFALVSQERPEHSILGIAIAVGALMIMPALARAKQRLGKQMGNAALIADSSESSVCAYLSGILLVGLVLNAALGWWWADPIAALGIAGFAFREGRAAWAGKECC
jgi:divalent metal cation (Fe/Co/Zn/Cd) transporter